MNIDDFPFSIRSIIRLFTISVPDYRDNQCDESLLHAIRTICVFV